MRFCAGLVVLLSISSGCSSGPQAKTQDYAELTNTKTLEHDFDVVWKGTKKALSDYRIEEADEEDGLIVTDWAYSTSARRYVEVKVNGMPRRKYLQTRYKYKVYVKRQIVGTQVQVNLNEQVENINNDGIFKGWSDAEEPDSARENETLKNIERTILSAP